MDGRATTLSLFHRTRDPAGFAEWAQGVAAAANGTPGHVESRVSALVSPEFDWAIATTFDREEDLHRWLEPAVTGWFRRWLDPVEGAGARVSVIGAVVVTGVYAVTLAIFASVTWLQFWDYLD